MLILFLLFASPYARPHTLILAGDTPVIQLDEDGYLYMGLPENVLDHEEVGAHLKTGLTTSFIHTVSLRLEQGTFKEFARVDVRYELWDELYLVSLHTKMGLYQKLSFQSFDELKTWWRGNNILVATYPLDPQPISDARVKVEVLPFSAAEMKAAQRWFVNTRQARKVPSGDDDQEVELGTDAFRIFLTTSIKRHPLLSFRWKVKLVR